MNLLIVMVGLARSGKSTWAQKQSIPIACPDAIRFALHGHAFIPLAEPMVWAISGIMVRSLFLAGHTIVIVDGCHVKHEQRQFWVDMGDREGWRTIFKPITTPELTCIKRCGEDDEMVGVVQRMGGEYEPLHSSALTVPNTIKEYIEGPWPGSQLLKTTSGKGKREKFII
jgi:predicted kinase